MLKTPIERIDDNEENKILSYNFDLFVSYCGNDKDEVYKLCDDLEQEGYKLWIDKNEMIVGNISELMRKGIDNSFLFMCCATTSYFSSDNCLLEFNYAINKKKNIIYILFEQFNGHDDRMKKLDRIAFRFAGQKHYKHENLEGIVMAIEELRKVF